MSTLCKNCPFEENPEQDCSRCRRGPSNKSLISNPNDSNRSSSSLRKMLGGIKDVTNLPSTLCPRRDECPYLLKKGRCNRCHRKPAPTKRQAESSLILDDPPLSSEPDTSVKGYSSVSMTLCPKGDQCRFKLKQGRCSSCFRPPVSGPRTPPTPSPMPSPMLSPMPSPSPSPSYKRKNKKLQAQFNEAMEKFYQVHREYARKRDKGQPYNILFLRQFDQLLLKLNEKRNEFAELKSCKAETSKREAKMAQDEALGIVRQLITLAQEQQW